MANNPQKTTINNYLPQNHMNMISQQPNNLVTNSLSKQPNMLSYGNTKPLTHFNTELSQRMTPPTANPGKNPMMPYIQQQQSQQPQMPAQMAHLSEEQKRMLIMKQKGMINQPMAYATLPALGQVSVSAQHVGNKKRPIQRLSTSLSSLPHSPPLSPGKYGMSLQMLLGFFTWYWSLIILRNN